MAIRHGLAGQYGKEQAQKRSKRIAGVLYVVGAYVLAGLGFGYGYSLAHGGPLMGLVGVIAIGVAAFSISRPVARYIDHTAKERIKYMRGGQGEALVAWVLERELDEDWHVFNTVKLEP